MNPTMTNPKAWVEVTPDFVNSDKERSPENYRKALAQFEVATNPRYVKGHDNDPTNGEETYCNIFLWDATKALGCEVPHWVDLATGVETAMGKGRELSANGVCDWFSMHGLKFGWMKCDEVQARRRASAGFPTVVLWRNVNGIGHVAMVLTGTDVTRIAQAGTRNFFDEQLLRGFGGATPLNFYTHD